MFSNNFKIMKLEKTQDVVVNFLAGDHDAILILLLIPRLVSKCELLINQVREKVNIILRLLFVVAC